MKARAFRRAISNASSTSSTASRRRIGVAPEPALAWRSAAASSRRKAVISMRGTAATALARFWRSASRCRRLPRSANRRRRMANAYTVLVVDDEPPIRRFLRASLAAAGHRVVTADDAAGALAAMAAEKPDLVILDLGLPDRSGFEVIAEIRKHSPVPIIVLSARSDERSKVEALDLGADDYIGKPFGMAELMARLRAALRHAFQAQGELPMCVSGELSVDLVRRHVTRDGREVKLSPKEFELLRHLVTHAGKVLTHRQLLREVWGPAQAEEVQYLRVFIRGLRPRCIGIFAIASSGRSPVKSRVTYSIMRFENSRTAPSRPPPSII